MKTAVAYLVIVILSSAGPPFRSSTPFPSIEECFTALDNAKMYTPGGEQNEAIAVAFCSYEDHTQDQNQREWY